MGSLYHFSFLLESRIFGKYSCFVYIIINRLKIYIFSDRQQGLKNMQISIVSTSIQVISKSHIIQYIHTTNKIKMIILQMWTSFKIIKICTIRVLWKIVATTCLSYNITSFFSLDILCILNLAFEGFASPIVSIKLYLKDKRISFFMMAEKEVVCYTF